MINGPMSATPVVGGTLPSGKITGPMISGPMQGNPAYNPQPATTSPSVTTTPPSITPAPTPAPSVNPFQNILSGIENTAKNVINQVKGLFTPAGGNPQPITVPKPVTPSVPTNQIANLNVGDKLPGFDLTSPGGQTPSATLKNPPKGTGNIIDDVLINPAKYILNNTGPVGANIKQIASNFYKDPIGTVSPAYKLTEQVFPNNSIQGFDNKVATDTIDGALSWFRASDNVNNFLNTRLQTDITVGDKTARTIGDLVGGIGTLIGATTLTAGTDIPAIASAAVFAILGQTRLPSTTSEQTRKQNLVIDSITGFATEWIGGMKIASNLVKGSDSELLKESINLVKPDQLISRLTLFSAQQYADMRSQGATNAQALQGVKQGAIVNLALAGIFGLIGFGEYATSNRFKEGSFEFTPDQARGIVVGSNLEGTDLGNKIMQNSLDAQGKGMNLKVDVTAYKQSLAAEALGLKNQGVSLTEHLPAVGTASEADITYKSPEGMFVKVSLVQPTAQIPSGQEPITTPSTETPSSERPSEPVVVSTTGVTNAGGEGSIVTEPTTFYRGGGVGSPPASMNAADVVKYEQEELGNADVKVVPGIDLTKIPSKNLVWVTDTEANAKEYGGPVEPVTLQNYQIVAKDSQGGMLINQSPQITATNPLPSPTETGVTTQAQKPLSPTDQKTLDMAREAIYTGDTSAGLAIYDSVADTNKPAFEDVVKEVQTEQTKELDGITNELKAESKTVNPDDPTNKLIAIADKIGKHFNAPGALFKITGKGRTYEVPGGLSMAVGGDAKSSLDRLFFETDITGFSKNIRILSLKFDKTFTEIDNSIRSGDIDGADYEAFKSKLAEYLAKRPTYSAGSSVSNAVGALQKPAVESTGNKNPSSPETRAVTPPGKVTVPEKFTPEPTVLYSGINPGLDKFLEQDVLPSITEFKEGTLKTVDFIKKVLNPSSRGELAQKSASIMRENLGRMARNTDIAFAKLEEARKIFDRYSKDQSLDFINKLETGEPIEGAEKFVTVMREALDSRWKQIQEIKGIDAYIENYFPHMWKDPEKAADVIAKSYAKRPFEGTKSYMKQRTIPTIKEGIDLNLTPASYNPVDSVMARVADMDRFLMANDTWNQFKDEGLRVFVRKGQKAPEGWVQPNDKIAKTFAGANIQYQEEGKIYHGAVQVGSWYMPEQAATILNNYLSPGLRGNPIYDAFRKIGNNLTQVQLGLSAFHATFTSIDAVISRASLGLQQVAEGKPVTGLRTLSSSPIAWITNVFQGDKLLKDYYREVPQVPDIISALERAGGRVSMDKFYHNNAVENFLKALRSGNLPGAVLRTPGALIETLAKPILGELVPRQKLGIFSDLAKDILDTANTKNWDDRLTTLRLQEAWDSVDNRMGQMVYDNLFWNKALKDLSMASVRSVGWNLGTIRELGGGVIQTATTPFKLFTAKGRASIRLTPKMAYTMVYPFIVGLLGAIIGYLYTKKAPQTLKDYFYPRTGRQNPDGTDERISLPSYMKDVFAYGIEPTQTVSNKINPFLGMVADMLKNQDYYGTEIRNPSDPIVQQLQEELSFAAKQYMPFSVAGFLQSQAAGDTLASQALSFFGLQPAPKYIVETTMQRDISNLYSLRNQGVKSPDTFAVSQAKSNIRRLYLLGQTDQANAEMAKLGLTKVATTDLIKSADIPVDVRLFQQLNSEDQQSLIAKMNMVDLQRYAWSSDKQTRSVFATLSSNAKNFADLVNQGKVKPPIWKRNQNINQ